MPRSVEDILLYALKLRLKRWLGRDPKPVFMGLMPTYLCNSRCTFCRIWKMYQETPELYDRELSSKQMCTLLFRNRGLLKDLRDVDISGGEPFLKKDFDAMLRCIHQIFPKARIAIATNGLEPERIVGTVKNIVRKVPLYAIRLSLDGMRKTHDALRGVSGGFDRAMRTINELLTLRDNNRFALGIGFTIAPSNYRELMDVFELSNELGIDFLCRSVHVGRHFRNIDQSYKFSPDSIREIHEMLTNIAKGRKAQFGHGWLGTMLERKLISFYHAGIESYIKNPSHMIVPCFAGSAAFMLDPYGYVFPCQQLPEEPMGNIRESHLVEFWASEKSKRIRKEIEKGLCPNCWMDCSMVNVKLDLVQISKWALRSFIKGST